MALTLSLALLGACTGGVGAAPDIVEPFTRGEEAPNVVEASPDTTPDVVLARVDTPRIDAGAQDSDAAPPPHAERADVIEEDVPAREEPPTATPDVPTPTVEDASVTQDAGLEAPAPVDVPAPREVTVPGDVPALHDAGIAVPVPHDVPPPRDVWMAPPAPPDVPPPRDVSMDVLAPRDVPPPRDVGMDVPPPRDVGMDVPPPRDVGMDVPPPRDVAPDVPPPRDVGVEPPVVPAMVGVPRIDATLKAAMRALYLRGQVMGNRAAVFAKLGDSITQSASFLSDFGPARGTPSWDLGAYGSLAPTLEFFNATLVDATHSSFDRESLGADSGWSTVRVLRQELPLIRQELATLRPAVAFVMFGSGDIEVLEVSEVGVFRSNLTRIVEVVVEAGTIPVLCTVPERRDYPWATARGPAFNAAIREVAAAMRVPLQDYSAALEPLPNHGISEDGVHPSIYRLPNGSPEAAYFTPPALAYGYNVRNLITLAALARVRAVVFNDGPPDP